MPAPLLPLLLLSAAPLSAALLVRDAEGGEAAEEQVPRLSRRLSVEEAEQERYEEGLLREYSYNLSHYRYCAESTDRVWVLAPLLIPELKLAFCYIPKAACSEFKDLFNTINEIKGAAQGFGSGYLASTASRLHFDKALVTREKGWKFAVFTRDPALRYLSAYGSTCVPVGSRTVGGKSVARFEHPQECCGPLVASATVSATARVKMFQERLLSDYHKGNALQEDHWSSQVNVFRQCGWEHFNPSTVDFHGDISTGDVNGQVRQMLSLNRPLSSSHSALVDRFFPKDRVAGHKSPMHKIPPEVFYSSKKLLRALMEVYSEDYKEIPGVGRGFTDKQLAKTASQRKWEAWTYRAGLARNQTAGEAWE